MPPVAQREPIANPGAQEVKAAIDAKIENAGHMEGIGGPAKQRCDNLESYQVAADWDVCMDAAQPRDTRLVRMAKRMQSLQLGTKGHTREQVFADGVAIAMHATLGAGPEHQHEALLCLRDLKSFVQDKQLPQEPDIYPRDPGEFEFMHPAIFAVAYAHEGISLRNAKTGPNTPHAVEEAATSSLHHSRVSPWPC